MLKLEGLLEKIRNIDKVTIIGWLFILFVIWFIYDMISYAVKRHKKIAKYLNDTEKDENKPPKLCEFGATVIGKRCEVKSEGTKRVFVKKLFYLGFRTEDGRELIFPVEEAMYLEVEEGQKGTLATLNGNYYGFYVEE